MESYYHKSVEQTFKELNTSKEGLSEQEAKERLSKHGENKLKEAKKKSMFVRFLCQFKDIMVIILLVAAAISLVFAVTGGEGSELIDACIIFGIVILNATLGVVQEKKAEDAMESLKKMSQPYSKVIRDGEQKQVLTSELVPGDIVLLEAGDVVPADMLLFDCASLKCDEASLTGESVAAEKEAGVVLPVKTALGDRRNMCFSSSTVVYGRGAGVVVATAHDAEMGKIATMLTEQKAEEATPLQKSLTKLGEIITIVVLSIAVIIFIVDLVFTTQPWNESLMTAVAIAVAAIPESLMVVVTIILSIGVTRLAKRNVIIRRMHAVETLGCCEVICSDKTGTITQNKMTVREVYVNEQILDAEKADVNDNNVVALIKTMTLCNDAKKQGDEFIGDPTETALIEYADKLGFKKKALETANKRVNEIPFDSVRKLMTTQNFDEESYVQYTKGAVDELIKCCTHIMVKGEKKKITEKDIAKIKEANTNLCSKALRVLGFAIKTTDKKEQPQLEENGLTFIGLVGMIDPPRKEVFAALEKCKRAGMKAVMITGDHKDTAYAIAKELGMVKNISEVVDGGHLDKFTDEQLVEEIKKFKVFTRVSPEHKVRIVKALRASGKVVAMTGDGVNDAPSIKSANIGIGMGKVGTEVTKEVSDMVLTDDNFATIVVAVEEGRKIFNNIQKTIQFLISTNIAEVISIFALTLAFPAIPFLVAVQILFINLITDSLPAIALGMERAEKDVMDHPPRKVNQSIIGGRVGVNLVYQGIAQSMLVIGVFLLGKFVFSDAVAPTMGFLTLNLIQLFHMYNMHTNHSIFSNNPFKNKTMLIAFIVGLGLLLLIALVPPLAAVFHLASLTWVQWLIVFGFALAIVPIVEIGKLIQAKIDKKKERENN